MGKNLTEPGRLAANEDMNNRRDFIRELLIGGGALLLAPRILSGHAITGAVSPDAPAADAWAQVPRILARIKAPVFPKSDFVITRYGAFGDGERDCTRGFQRAIAACSR